MMFYTYLYVVSNRELFCGSDYHILEEVITSFRGIQRETVNNIRRETRRYPLFK